MIKPTTTSEQGSRTNVNAKLNKNFGGMTYKQDIGFDDQALIQSESFKVLGKFE
jgi:hypothetical protein